MSGIEVEVTRELPFSAVRVWAVLGDFANIAWANNPAVEVIGSGVGMTRRVLMPGLAPIDEVLESLDDARRTFSYTIPRGLPMPVGDYRADICVEELTAQSCRVRWRASATPLGVEPAEATAILQDVYGRMLGWLEQWIASH